MKTTTHSSFRRARRVPAPPPGGSMEKEPAGGMTVESHTFNDDAPAAFYRVRASVDLHLCEE